MSTMNSMDFDTVGLIDAKHSMQVIYIAFPIYFKHEYKNITFKHGIQGLFRYFAREVNKSTGQKYGESYKSRSVSARNKKIKKLNWGYLVGVEYKINHSLYLELNAFISRNRVVADIENSRTIYSILGVKYKM